MKSFLSLFWLVYVLLFCLVGCQSHNKSTLKLISADVASRLSPSDIMAMSQLACMEMDEKAVIPASYHKMSQRLNRVALTLPQTINHIKLNYKVYLDTEPNAWSTANGCIRINSGLIKLLNDAELQAVIAHEQAHIALQHFVSSFQQASYIELADKVNEIVIFQKEAVAQQHEIEADNYAFDLLVNQNIDPIGLVGMLSKMPIHAVKDPASHPSTLKRINNILDKMSGK
ncbi:M48 family metalloprotease [Gilliamella sp. B2969]|uniref:M48 family metalloprotease n=1 Tax=unclassified Gilliamella TaxID=2685620 RepID=UPI002269CF7E|nr:MULTISPECIES: M48 family metalloprotease [unclassified Gilliamella]MCX8712879.1 M48 family metalloprotease [Gilliamella sp. B3468]MCX8728502.1 M48 family metalloprotease [Gilliamella sp. B2838]MCX8730980.1 M48 family metalloprotease [Gilliamella sp. B2969]MCX8751982.1 M48 family metalloprotease [Gilliamella sp. B3464]